MWYIIYWYLGVLLVYHLDMRTYYLWWCIYDISSHATLLSIPYHNYKRHKPIEPISTYWYQENGSEQGERSAPSFGYGWKRRTNQRAKETIIGHPFRRIGTRVDESYMGKSMNSSKSNCSNGYGRMAAAQSSDEVGERVMVISQSNIMSTKSTCLKQRMKTQGSRRC